MKTLDFLATIGGTAFVFFCLGWLIKRRLTEDVYQMYRITEYRLSWCVRVARNALAVPESRRAELLEQYMRAIAEMCNDA